MPTRIHREGVEALVSLGDGDVVGGGCCGMMTGRVQNDTKWRTKRAAKAKFNLEAD